MTERATLLHRLEPGDIFAAHMPNDGRLVCIVTSVTDTAIHVRHVMSGQALVYDRRTGAEIPRPGDDGSTIKSVAPLPIDMHHALLAFDRKYRLGQGDERFKLSADEKTMLFFFDEHYDACPLPV
jgi:hypothetical protein